MTYTVEWEQEVLNEFDDPEGPHTEEPFTVVASSIEEVVKRADNKASVILSEKRKGQNWGHFTSHVIALTDKNGQRTQVRPPITYI